MSVLAPVMEKLIAVVVQKFLGIHPAAWGWPVKHRPEVIAADRLKNRVDGLLLDRFCKKVNQLVTGGAKIVRAANRRRRI